MACPDTRRATAAKLAPDDLDEADVTPCSSKRSRAAAHKDGLAAKRLCLRTGRAAQPQDTSFCGLPKEFSPLRVTHQDSRPQLAELQNREHLPKRKRNSTKADRPGRAPKMLAANQTNSQMWLQPDGGTFVIGRDRLGLSASPHTIV